MGFVHRVAVSQEGRFFGGVWSCSSEEGASQKNVAHLYRGYGRGQVFFLGGASDPHVPVQSKPFALRCFNLAI